MDGSIELMNLAYMLRLGAGVAAEIAALRPCDAVTIERLARQAAGMAEEIDRLLWVQTSSMPYC